MAGLTGLQTFGGVPGGPIGPDVDNDHSSKVSLALGALPLYGLGLCQMVRVHGIRCEGENSMRREQRWESGRVLW